MFTLRNSVADFILGATIRTWRTKYRKGLAQLKAKHGANYDPEIHENEVQAEMKVHNYDTLVIRSQLSAVITHS